MDFVTTGKRRISYASSFAQAKLEEKFRKDMADSLRGFFSIAVRESNGVKIVKKLIGKDVPITLDPTLLLRKDVVITNEAFANKLKNSAGPTASCR